MLLVGHRVAGQLGLAPVETKGENGVIVSVEIEPDDTQLQISHRTRVKNSNVGLDSFLPSDGNVELASLDRVLPNPSRSIDDYRPIDADIFIIFENQTAVIPNCLNNVCNLIENKELRLTERNI